MLANKGFTLVEAIVVVAVLCVMSVYAYPEVDDWKSKSYLKSQTAGLVSGIYRARSAAVKRNANVVFHYDANGYIFFVDNGEGGGTKNDWVHQPGETVLNDVKFDSGTQILVGESTFTLNRTRFSGRAGVKAGSVVLSLGGEKSKIIINTVGRVRTEKI